MTETAHSDSAGVRKSLRPILIAPPREITEHAPFLRRLLVGLADESIPAALICPPSGNGEHVAPAPAEIFTYPTIDLPWMDHVGFETLAAALERFKPTILHCLCGSRAALARRLARRLRIPYVLNVNRLPGKLHRLAISPDYCAKIVVPAETIGAAVRRAYPRFAGRVQQIPMGTFAESGPVCFSDPSQVSSIVVAHRIDRVSDFEALLKAARVLLAEGHEFVMAIMGSGRAEHRLRKALAEHGLTRIVTVVPVLETWRAVLAAGDVYIHLQPTAAFNGFLLEAMSIGVAVVACKGGVDDQILHQKTAILYERNNETSLRQALVHLFENHDAARQLAASAQNHLREHYSVGAYIAATLYGYVEAQREHHEPAVSERMS